ncbi:MAG: SPASM domain-containing protein, partial [Oligoflexia bacterium]|nr:SPASM domain-containing protein [Oligoflexia bacterium]
MKLFDRVYIEISNICNLQCSFCPEVIREKKQMPLELFEKAISEVAPLTNQVALHLMGDPLTHPKLEGFLGTCQKYDLPVNLTTNGVLLNSEKKELLKSTIIRQINFSLHSYPDNFPKRDFSEYLSKILDFTDNIMALRHELFINFRLWTLQDPKTIQNANQKMLEFIELHYGFKMAKSLDVRFNKSFKIKNRLYLHFDTEFTWPSPQQPFLSTQGTCYGLSSHFGILADGTVVPCCLDKEGDVKLGNIEHNSITEILESPKAKKILEGFRHHRLVEDLCQRCTYIR